VGNITVRVVPDGDRVGLVVEDDGCGMNAAVHARIFDPFFSTKPTHEGTGLGLSICRDLIRSNGSDIQVASTPGAGTTFTVWLPDATAEAPLEASRPAEAHP
jgi:signal transduction histidine kinase